MIFSNHISSQSILFPQEYIFEQYKNQQNYTTFSRDTCVHSSVFPLINSNSQAYDSLNYYKEGRIWFYRKLLQDNFISISGKDTIGDEVNTFKLSIDPILNLCAGNSSYNNETKNTYTNSRGIIANLRINSKFKIETAFIENQSVFPVYISNQINYSKDVLGQGRWKNFKLDGYDYAMSSGALGWKISKNVELIAGHGKQKIGNGYRTFLLSDRSFNYPYARIDLTSNKLKLKYTATYAVLMNIYSTVDNITNKPFGTEPLLQKKPFSYQYISYQPFKNINIGLFQGIVWKYTDEKNKSNLSANFLNPILFSNLATYGFNSHPKIVAGLEANIKFTKNTQLFLQTVSDGQKNNSNKIQSFGLQTGIKLFDAFTLKNLFIQLEYNKYGGNLFQQNTFSGSEITYSHYEQALSYATKTNFDGNEIIGLLAYKNKRLLFSSKAIYCPLTNFENSSTFLEGKLAFVLQPKTNMNISLNCILKDIHKTKNSSKTQWIYFSLVTSLFNNYFDF